MKRSLTKGFKLLLLLWSVIVLPGCESTSVAAVEITSVVVSPSEIILLVNATRQLTASARGASGNALSGRTITWSSANPSIATVDQSGVVRGVASGTAIIRATAEGVTGQATVTVNPRPSIVLSQSQVRFESDFGGGPTEFATVDITNGTQGTLSELRSSTTYPSGGPQGWLEVSLSSGTAPATLNLRAIPTVVPAGTHTADVEIRSAVAGNSPQTIRVVLQVGEAPPSIAVSTEVVSFASDSGQANPPPQTVTVTNGGGGVISGLSAVLAYEAGSGSGWLQWSLNPTTAPADLTITVDPEGLVPGVYDAVITLSAASLPGSMVEVRVRYRFGTPPPEIELPETVEAELLERTVLSILPTVVVGNRGTGTFGDLTTVLGYGAGEPTGWLEAILDSNTGPTNMQLQIRTGVLLPGEYTATVTVSSPDAINSPQVLEVILTVLPRPSLQLSTITATPSAIVADGISMSTIDVQINDLRGDPMPTGGNVVTLSATVGFLGPVTDNGGGAYSAVLRSTALAQQSTVTGMLDGQALVDDAVVDFVPGPAAQLAITTQPVGAESGAQLATQPVVEVQDIEGNLRTTDNATQVAVTIQSGAGGTLGGTTSVTVSGGIATFTDLTLSGIVGVDYTLRFSSVLSPPDPTVTFVDSDNVTVTPGPPTQVVITTQPVGGPSGELLTAQPVVEVQDAQGNLRTGDNATQVAVSILTGAGGTLGGTTPVTVSGGVATLTDLTMAGTVGENYVLRFSSVLSPPDPTATVVDSDNVTVTPGPPAQLVITAQPPNTAESGTPLVPAPSVQLQDAWNNSVNQAGVDVGVTHTGDGFLSGATLVPTNGSGQVIFSNLSITGTAGDRTLQFTSAGLPPVDSNTITLTSPPNTAPTLDPINPPASVNESTLWTFTATASDTDVFPTQTLTFTLAGTVPAGASINPTSGVFTWTPSEAQGPGAYTFDVVVTDDGAGTLSDSETINITVNEANVAPTLDPINPPASANELALWTFTATASDTDAPAQTLTFTLAGAVPAGASINPASGVFTWTPSEAQGPSAYTFDVVVTDDGPGTLSDSETINITVNEVNTAPTLDPINPPASVNESALWTFTATASDTDAPAQTLTFTLAGTVPAGASINPTSGVFTWTPSEAQGPGAYTFDVVVTDDGPGTLSDSETINITVNEANVAPTLDPINPPASVNELALWTFTATASDTDAPAQTLTFTLAGAVPAGASINPTSGVFTWTPSEAQGPAAYTFDVVVTDDGAGTLSDSETINITVNEANVAPTLDPINPPASVNELALWTFTATASDTDLPAQTLTFTLAGAVPAGASINPTSGVFTWTPSEAQGPAAYTFDVVVTDDGPGTLSDSETINITVNETNTAPTLDPINPPASVNELALWTFTATASDTDAPAQTLTFTLAGTVPAGASINPASGVFTWTPSEAQGPGAYTFDVVVTDDGPGTLSDSGTINITVNEANVAPTLDPINPPASANELALWTFTATASDTDAPAQTLTFTLAGAVPAGASINPASGVFTWTPSEAQGPSAYTFDVVVTDDGPGTLSDSETINITVNEVNTAPTLDPINPPASVNESALWTFTATASDTDAPAQTLTFTLAGTVPAGASINPTSGVFTWTPSEAQGPGAYTFDVVVTDDGPGTLSDSETINITVNETNTAPTLDPINPPASVNELALWTFTATASDTDAPAQTLTFTLAGAVPAGASINPTSGVFTWTPSEAQGPAAYTFDVVVTDDGAGTLSDSETINITVNEANVAPTLDPINPPASVNESALWTFTATASDTDAPAQTLTFTLAGAVPAGASINPTSGVFTWTPSEAQGPAAYTFDVVVTDDGPGTLSDSETINITVNETNTAPTLDPINPPASVNELALWTFTATASDTDAPAQTLTFTLAGTVPAGASINPASGVFTWTPSEAQGPGAYTFDVVVTDDGPGTLSDSETINITVNEANVAPTLDPINPPASANELALWTFTATASDTDAPAQTLTFTLAGAVPAGASINPASGVFTWTPSEAQGPSAYTFDVVVTDDGPGTLSDSETINITVNEVNTAPTLDPINPPASVNESALWTFTATASDTDAPAQTLTFTLAGTVPAGASINPTSGVFTWTPSEAQGPGAYTFDVVVTDDGPGTLSDSETINITVNEANVAPTLDPINPPASVNELALWTFTATASDTDAPAQTLTFTLAGAVPAGASINPTSGVFTWTPSEAQGPAAYTFDVVVTDDGAGTLSDSETINITVNEANVAPTLDPINPPASVNELALWTFTATASDTDLPAQTLTFTLAGAVPAGASINPTSGVFTWTPSEAQGPAAYTFDVVVTDDGPGTLSDSETINITVNETNTAPTLDPINPPASVNELALWTFTATASDTDAPAQTLTFTLAGTVPAGASINPASGVFTWTPSEAQGPGAYTFDVVVTDDGAGTLSDSETINIVVNEVP